MGMGMAMTMTLKHDALEAWESAWSEYVQACENFDACRPDRHERGHMRAWSNACHRRRKAIAALRNLDADFCDRLGVK